MARTVRRKPQQKWNTRLTIFSMVLGIVISLLAIGEKLFNWMDFIIPDGDSKQIVVSVRVIDARLRSPIPGAKISINAYPDFNGLSNLDGRYSGPLRGARLGDKLIIFVEHHDYLSLRLDTSIVANETHLDFVMSPKQAP